MDCAQLAEPKVEIETAADELSAEVSAYGR